MLISGSLTGLADTFNISDRIVSFFFRLLAFKINAKIQCSLQKPTKKKKRNGIEENNTSKENLEKG